MATLTVTVSAAAHPDVFSLEEVVPRIPIFFIDNGNSSPGKRFWPWLYDDKTIEALNKVGRPHDFGYTYARLKGSGMEHMSKWQWDKMLAKFIIDNGGKRRKLAAFLERSGLTAGGWPAWIKNGRMMKKMGDVDYATWFTRKEAA